MKHSPHRMDDSRRPTRRWRDGRRRLARMAILLTLMGGIPPVSPLAVADERGISADQTTAKPLADRQSAVTRLPPIRPTWLPDRESGAGPMTDWQAKTVPNPTGPPSESPPTPLSAERVAPRGEFSGLPAVDAAAARMPSPLASEMVSPARPLGVGEFDTAATYPTGSLNRAGSLQTTASSLDTGTSLLDEQCEADFCDSDCRPEYFADDFSPTPLPTAAMQHDGWREQCVYDGKRDVPTQHPWVEWGRIFYGDGITPRGWNLWGEKNLARPKFYVYGDLRTAVATGRNAAGRTDNWATRLNLDLDLQLTDTERFHSFIGLLDNGAQFTRLEKVNGDWRWENEANLNPLTGYFEGDLGVLLGTVHNETSPFELPFTIGLVPLLFQNGIWMEDGVTGAAMALPARHSRLLNWSNFDATFFAVFDQLNSAAFGKSEHAGQAFGTAWFIEAYGGYIETGYAYVRDRNRQGRSYHNITTSFTRRYWDRISNSVRVIVNTGQDLPAQQRSADGVLLLVENSLITDSPLTFVPYANFFVGWDRPQSVARAGASGGILRNTGINFDTDGLNGFATLDPTGSDTAGASIGVDLLGRDLEQQLLLEMAFLMPHGSKNAAVAGDQFALGTRYQFPISNWTLLRFDTMYGWRRGLEDVYGTRMEYRWKF